jgi:hypothetical protein
MKLGTPKGYRPFYRGGNKTTENTASEAKHPVHSRKSFHPVIFAVSWQWSRASGV